jgi:hypothetical protein
MGEVGECSAHANISRNEQVHEAYVSGPAVVHFALGAEQSRSEASSDWEEYGVEPVA